MASESSNLFFRALYDHCAAKPLAAEDHPWGETVFKIGGKVFAFLGRADQARVVVKAAADEIDGLLILSFVRRSPYIGRYGWVQVSVDNDDALDVALRLIDRSYDLIAAKLPHKKRSQPQNQTNPASGPKRTSRPKRRPRPR